MTTLPVDSIVSEILVDRRLVDHPFYQRWDRGDVTRPELASYAAQYRHFERFLPVLLARLVADLPDGDARHLVASNLADELFDPMSHVQLFELFADAVGAEEEIPSPAIESLIACYEELLKLSPRAALAGFLAYEIQASDIARRKAEGLRNHYGLDGDEVLFWDHHAHADALHGQWTLHALQEQITTPEEVGAPLRLAANAWWAFLDERESLRVA